MDFSELSYASEKLPINKALLGLCHEHGWGTRPDKEKALFFYLAGAKEGDLLSRLCLADYYMEYSSDDEDREKAFSIYQEMADTNNIIASYKLASCLQLGFGVAKDLGLARKYALSAANAGYPPAQEMVGLMYLDEEDDRDLAAAHKWLEAASSSGMSSAAFRLAHLFETGEGVSKDVARAIYLYKSAASLGSWAAHGRLAQAYRLGQLGLKIDFDESEMHTKAESELLKRISEN